VKRVSRNELEEWLKALQGMQEKDFEQGEDYEKLYET
jgi:hypothetical protein